MAALKSLPIHSADYIFLLVLDQGILRNQKIIISLDSFSNQYFGSIWIILVFVSDKYTVESCQITVIVYRVTDEV